MKMSGSLCVLLFVFTASCSSIVLSGCGSSGTASVTPTHPIPPGPTAKADVTALVTGIWYYLDAVNGNDDTGDGSSEHPWQTLVKSQSVPEGSGVILRSGNYGAFNDDAYTSDRSAWVVYINEEGATPEFTHIDFTHSHGPRLSLRLVFYGIKITPQWVDPVTTSCPSCAGISSQCTRADAGCTPAACNLTDTGCPLDPNSDSYTYQTTGGVVGIGYRSSIRFHNCEFVGTNKHLTGEAFYLNDDDDIIIERCHIHKTSAGIAYVRSTNIQMNYNYLHEICNSHFRDGGGCSNIKIEGNHAHDANWDNLDYYSPRAPGKTYHGSCVAISSPSTTVRNNILHDCGVTNGINFYTNGDGTPVYSNMLVENNVVYNPHNTTCINVDLVADDVVIRNNTFVGSRRETDDTNVWKYNAALSLSSVAEGYTGSGLHFYNNLIIGMAGYGSSWGSLAENVDEGHNLIWSGTGFVDAHTKTIISEGTGEWDYFEDGFFNGPLDISCYESSPTGSTCNGRVLDLTLAPGSEGINFGDPSYQPVDSLGALDNHSEFIMPNGRARDADHHSAGCYEP